METKYFSIAVALTTVVAVVFLAVAIGATSAQVMPGSAHSKLSCTDCHGSAPFAEINISSIETCKKCHPKEVEETMSSKHAGLGATRPDTMPNTCLVCHNPHQGVYKDGKWEDQTVAEYNKFAFKLKEAGIIETEHTWRTFSSMNEFCLDCHGRGDHGKNVSDPSKVTGKEGVWLQHDWYGNDRPIPEIEGLGDERGALPMDDPDFISYNVWKMEKKHYGAGNAPYGSANYTEGIENCSHACHYGGELLVMHGKKVPPSGYECSDCHPKTKDTVLKIETGSHASYLTQDCTDCHKPHLFSVVSAATPAPTATVAPTAAPTATPTATPTPTPPGFEVLFAVVGVGIATVIYTNMKRRGR